MTVTLATSFASFSDVPDVSRGPVLTHLMWAMLGLSILVVTLRIYAKISTARKLYVDDWLTIAAVVSAVVHAALTQVAINNGFGRHMIYLPWTTINKAMTFEAWSLFWGYMSPTLGRASSCFTLIFLARTDLKFRTWPMYTVVAMQLSLNVTGIIIFYTQCGSDLDTFWTPAKQLHYRDYCRDPQIQLFFGYFLGSLNTVTDGFLAIMPALLVHRTNMSLKRKLGVAMLLCFSSFAMIASIVKTYESKLLSRASDITHDLVPLIMALAIELNIVIIAASVPFLRPLFLRRSRPPTRSNHLLGQVKHYPLSSASSSKNHSRTNTFEDDNVSTLVPSPTTTSSATQTRSRSRSRQRGTWTTTSEIQGTITVTTDVSVSYQKLDAPYMHAALVGFVFEDRRARDSGLGIESICASGDRV